LFTYLPGQASYLAVLRPFELGEDLSPWSGAAFPRWLSPEGELAIQLPAAPLTPAMERRIGDLRRSRLRWALKNRLLRLEGEEGKARLESCPPCSRPLDGYRPFCKQRLCPFCYGRYHVEYFYRSLAAVTELLWAEGKRVYVALDTRQLYSHPDGSLPAWEPAENRSLLGSGADNQRVGLIELCRPLHNCEAADRRTLEACVRVFCPLPAALSGVSRTQRRPVLNARWLRVHSEPPSPITLCGPDTPEVRPHLVREVGRLSDLVPLVAATCEFPLWMFDPRSDAAEVAEFLEWSQGHQLRASYGSLLPKSLDTRLFGRLDRSDADRVAAVKTAFYARYADTPGRPLTDVHRVIEGLAFEHGVQMSAGRKRSRPGRTPQETARAALQRSLPGWSATTTEASPSAFPGMQAVDPSQLRVVQGPDGTWYLGVPLNQEGAPLDTPV